MSCPASFHTLPVNKTPHGLEQFRRAMDLIKDNQLAGLTLEAEFRLLQLRLASPLLHAFASAASHT